MEKFHELATGVLADQIDVQQCAQFRQTIGERVLRESKALRVENFQTINTSDLFELFVHYDDLFFDGQLEKIFDRSDHLLKFRLSSRMTSTGGTTTYERMPDGKRRRFEIAISSTLLFNTPFDQAGIKVGGVATQHRLDALQRIMEHELVHLLEMLLWDDSSCARQRFKSIVKRFFGHMESNHQLVTPQETAHHQFGIATGDRVQFHHQGHCLTGIVNGINRRATVLVRDAAGELYADNLRYSRFYVPIDRLQPIKNHRHRSTGRT